MPNGIQLFQHHAMRRRESGNGLRCWPITLLADHGMA
jgi:hypothetical protein